MTVQIPKGTVWDVGARLPEGKGYTSEVESVGLGQAKSSGNPQLTIKLVCQDEGENQGKVAFDYVTLTEASMWRLAPYGVACGAIDPSDPSGSEWGEGAEIDEQEIVGASVMHDIVEEPPNQYHSGPKLSVQNVQPAG